MTQKTRFRSAGRRAGGVPKTAVKPLVALTLLSLAVAAQAATTLKGDQKGPFAAVPLHLQAEASSKSGEGVKPNVLLQVDDSGSMGTNVDGTRKSRMTVTKEALERLVTNPDYKDRVNWNMITLCNTEGSGDADAPHGLRYQWPNRTDAKTFGFNTGNYDYGRKVFQRNLPSSWRFGLNVDQDLVPAIRRLYANCGTPSTSRYLDSLYVLQAAMDRPDAYRCQKNYVVIFSDGDANDGGVSMAGSSLAGFRVNQINDVGAWNGPWWAGVNPRTYLTPAGFNFNDRELVYTDSGGNPNYAYPIFLYHGSGQGYLFKTRIHPSASTGYGWTNNKNMLGFFADSVYQYDLKTGGVDAAGKSWDDPEINGGKQNIATFTIGFGDTLSNFGKDYLNRAATGNNYQALNASNQAQLDAAFKTIFDQINSENKSEPPQSFANISPTLSGDDTDVKVPALAAAVRLDLKSGSSEVRFYDVANAGGKTTVLPTYKTADVSKRTVLLNTGSKTFYLNRGGSGSLIDGGGGYGSNRTFGIPSNGVSTNLNTNEWKDSMIPWITRSKPDNDANLHGNPALKYRVRSTTPVNTRDMGDVIAAPIHSYGPQKYGRQQFFVTAANDGMVYLFESDSNPNHPYALKLNYIPGGMQRESDNDLLMHHFADIVSPDYITDPQNHPHRYMINGGMTIRTTDKSAPQRHFLVGNMGQGGRGAYALNLGGYTRDGKTKVGLDGGNDAIAWLKSVPLFETPKTNNQMGYTIGAPQIGRLAVNRSYAAGKMTVDYTNVQYAAFIGSGTRNPSATHAGGIITDNTEAALYVFNALERENVGFIGPGGGSLPINSNRAGEQLAKIVVPNATANRGGLMQPTIIDMDFDGTADIAYAADFQGGLYRFDFRNGYKNATAHKIFQAQTNQVVTSAPAVYRQADNKYIVVFGTGSDLYQEDQKNTDTQSVYGIYDDLTVASPALTPLSALLRQTMTSVASAAPSGGGQVRSLSTEKIDEAKHKGWYFNLPAGERVVVKPDLLLKTVVFTTRNYTVQTTGGSSSGSGPTPKPDPCVAETSSTKSSGESWLMQVKVDSGGNLEPKDGMEYAYIDFFNNNANKDKSFRPSAMFAGYKAAGGGILSYVMLAGGTNANQVGHVGNAYTLSGDLGGTGTDITLTPGGQNVRQCLSGSNHSLFLSDSSAAQGVQDPLSVYGKVCESGGLKRISWREIFE